jgi:hypothetical protein
MGVIFLAISGLPGKWLPRAERGFGAENEWTTAIVSLLARVYSDTGRDAQAEALFDRVRLTWISREAGHPAMGGHSVI